MCVNGCREIVSQKLNRRNFFKAVAATTAVAAIPSAATAVSAANEPSLRHGGSSRRRVVDLTHRLVKTFPSFLGPQAVFDEVEFTIEESGFYSKQWTFSEHIGTHMDAPGHFTPGATLVDALDPGTLLVPIVVVDIAAKAESNPNATVDPEDLVAFERRYGRIPPHACIAMYSGWDEKVNDPTAYRGGVGFPDLNFPGFSADAIDWLLNSRHISGIAVDTLSLDPGNSADFAVHVNFLAAEKWGIENMANLGRIPPRGADIFVGVIPWEEGSGGPCRVLAQI